jgi:hypothetical protein
MPYASVVLCCALLWCAVQVSVVRGDRVVTVSEFEQQKEAYKDATAICLW